MPPNDAELDPERPDESERRVVVSEPGPMTWARLCEQFENAVRVFADVVEKQDVATHPPPMTMTPAEVARELGISERTLRRHVQEGKIGPAAHKLGDAHRWVRDEVTRWILAGMPDRDTWRALHCEIAPALRRVSAAQNNGRREVRRP